MSRLKSKFNTKSLLYGTLILTLANAIVRILGFVYRIFISRLIGPQGLGLIQLVFPIYMISITIIASGIPVAISRLISERKALGDDYGIKRIVRLSTLLVVSIALTLTAILLYKVDFITENILHESRTRFALLILFPGITVTGLGEILKCYFYGIKDVGRPAIAEIIEQVIRMILVVGILYYFAPQNYGLCAAIAIFGMVIGELSSLLFLHYGYLKSVKHYKRHNHTPSQPVILRNIVQIASPITLIRLISSFMSAINAILIPQRLMAGGMMKEDAVGLLGIVNGMAMPLIFLPFTITSALAVVIIPNISENTVLAKWGMIRDKVSKAILITCLTAFPSTALLTALGTPLGYALYKQPDVGKYLIPMAACLIFHCLQHTSNSILNGLGKQNRSAIHYLVGGTIQIMFTYFATANPSIGIYGFILGFITNSVIVSLLNMTLVFRTCRMRFKVVDWIVYPGLAGLLMYLGIRIAFLGLIKLGLSYVITLIVCSLGGIALFFGALFMLGGIPGALVAEIFKGVSSSFSHSDTKRHSQQHTI